jgi:hypothetical protein
MGFLRRRHHPAADEFDPPSDIDVPEGMAAVPEEKVIEWAGQLVSEANEMAVSKTLPDVIDLCAKVALEAVCGNDRARAFPGGTHLLGYNLFLHGYWCRAAEMRMLARNEASAEVADQLRIAHARGLGGEEWFGTLQGASYGLAGWDEGVEDLIAAVRSALPQDAGAAMHQYCSATALAALCEGIDAQHPGASPPLTRSEMRECWDVGYWMRAVSMSLPDEAHIEFRQQ